MQAYFDREEGLGYSLLRTTIHSSDFASGSYTYIKEGDSASAPLTLPTTRNTASR